MIDRRVSIAVVLCLVAAVGHARQRSRPVPRPRIVNGVFTSGFPTTGALLVGTSPGSAFLSCTGTMIGCRTFLTAAHCVCNDVGPACQPGHAFAPDPGRHFVFLQHAGVFRVSSIAVEPSYDFPVGDVAVITLSTPVTGITPTRLAIAAPVPGTTGTITGFGQSEGSAEDYGLKRTGRVTVAPCRDGVSNTTSVCWDFVAPVGAPGTDSNTCNGDSGGPLFVDNGCGPAIAGITSGGSSGTCLPDDHSYDANVVHYRTFIEAHAGADLDSATCGALPQLGDAGVATDGVVDSLAGTGDADVHTLAVPVDTVELRVALNALDDGSRDFDLYVRAGAPPTTSTYDCKSDGSGQFGACIASSPTSGAWYAMVHSAAGGGTYQLTTTTFGAGGPGGGSGGACDDGNPCTHPDTCDHGFCEGTPGGEGDPCDDGHACTAGDACAGGVCVGTDAPIVGCHAPLLPGKSSVALKNNLVDARDTFVWKWTRGDAAFADFGNPNAGTGYELCVFDRTGGAPRRTMDVHVPAGPSWKTTTTGHRFTDRLGTSRGVTNIKMKSGVGNATLSLKAKGASIGLPWLPLEVDPAVTIQWTNGTACWSADYGTALRNDVGQFKARSD